MTTLEDKYRPLLHKAAREKDWERVQALLDEVGAKMEEEEADASADA